MQFFIDITNASGTRYGAGPIASASYWKSTKRVDAIGDFEFAMPASDEKASLIQARRYATCYAILDEAGPTEVGSGIIDRIELRATGDGDVELVVGGDDLLRELAWRTFGRLGFGGAGAVTHNSAVASLVAQLPIGWSATADPTPPHDALYYFFNGESHYAAALKLAELSRTHVWMPTPRILRYQSTWTNSGLRAVEAPANPNLSAANLCYIDRLTRAEDTFDLIARVFPWGGLIPAPAYAEYQEPLTIDYADAPSVPVGYTIAQDSHLWWYIERDSAALTYGQIEAWINYPDIVPGSSSGAVVAAAANQLVAAAVWDLQRRSEAASYYELSLAHAPAVIQPMQTIRCVFRRVVDGRNAVQIDETLYILSATTTVDSEGLRTTGLEVATLDRRQAADIDVLRKLAIDNSRLNFS